MKSTIDVEIECLGEIVAMLRQFDIRVIGSKEASGMVCLAIEGPLVPDVSKVMVGCQLFVGEKYATLTARCDPDS